MKRFGSFFLSSVGGTSTWYILIHLRGLFHGCRYGVLCFPERAESLSTRGRSLQQTSTGVRCFTITNDDEVYLRMMIYTLEDASDYGNETIPQS